MKKFGLALSCIFIVTFVVPQCIFAVPASSDNSSELKDGLSQLLKIHKKRLTLNYLADDRSHDFLNDQLKNFAVPLRKNFRSNITGQYRKILLGNYDAKIGEVSKDLVPILLTKPEFETATIKTVKDAPFPLNLAFLVLVKNLVEGKTFTATHDSENVATPPKNEGLVQLKELLSELTFASSKDPYNAVKKMYSKTEPRDFPIWWFDDAQYEVGYTTHGENPAPPTPQKRKKWTVLVFLNADNNLENAGVKDVNEMEMVGSDENLNIVTQFDRMESGQGNDISNENWTGTRRYYVVRDRSKTVASKMVMNLGERDMGSKKELAEFLSWGVETYPADHFMVVIWNHGGGWKGISFDDESGKNLSIPDIVWAINQANPSLSKVNPKHPKFDVLDFDACMMGMLEVAYELKDVVDFLVASEETEPGLGMPYQDTLSPLKESPGMQPKTLAKNLVSAYVKSYSLGGSQTSKRNLGSSITKSAYDLSKIAPLASLVNKLAEALLANHELYSKLLTHSSGQFAKVRRYNDESFVDLYDLVMKLALIKDLPDDIRGICAQIINNFGFPKLVDRLSQPIVIKRKSPGGVVWGYNGWKFPPKEIWPPQSGVYKSRFALTLLKGPDSEGNYSCELGPFGMAIDQIKKKREFVTEINFRVLYENGKKSPDFTDRTGKEYGIVTQFATESALIAEGHTQGMGNSYGISIYYPYCLDFKTMYKTLKFAKETSWDELVAKIPEYHRNSPILLIGGMVQEPTTLGSFIDAFQKNRVQTADVLWDPKVFGFKFADILSQYHDGAVFTDSVSANSFNEVAPSADDLCGYLNGGGSLFIAAQSAEQKNVTLRFLEEYFKFSYVDDDRDLPNLTLKDKDEKPVILSLNGEDSIKSAGDVTIMDCSEPAVPFLTTEDGRKAGIAIKADSPSGNPYRGVFLGIRFEAITGAENRAALLGKALSFLIPPAK